MFLLVLAHLGCPGQNSESRKIVVCVLCIKKTKGKRKTTLLNGNGNAKSMCPCTQYKIPLSYSERAKGTGLGS